MYFILFFIAWRAALARLTSLTKAGYSIDNTSDSRGTFGAWVGGARVMAGTVMGTGTGREGRGTATGTEYS